MSPWVADASIRRMFPGTLAVVIEERQPIGIGRIKGTLYLIDKTGTVIDEFGPNYADLDLPIVDGLSPKGEDGQSVDEARAALAGRLMSELAQSTQACRAGLADRRHRFSQRHRDAQGRHGAAACWRRALHGAAAVVPRSHAGASRANAGHRLRRSALRRTGVRQTTGCPASRAGASAGKRGRRATGKRKRSAPARRGG